MICDRICGSLLQGDMAEARRYVKRLLQMGVSVGCVTATAILLGRNVLPQLFSPDPTVIAAAATALPVVAASMVRANVVSLCCLLYLYLLFVALIVCDAAGTDVRCPRAGQSCRMQRQSLIVGICWICPLNSFGLFAVLGLLAASCCSSCKGMIVNMLGCLGTALRRSLCFGEHPVHHPIGILHA